MAKSRIWLALVIPGLLTALLASCSQEPESVLPPPTTPPPSIGEELEEPELSTALKRDCQLNQSSSSDFKNAGLGIGEIAVNFTLKDIHGSEIRLSQLLAEKPVVMVFGSFT